VTLKIPFALFARTGVERPARCRDMNAIDKIDPAWPMCAARFRAATCFKASARGP